MTVASLGPYWLGASRSCLAAAVVGGGGVCGGGGGGSDILHHLITPEPPFTRSACQSLIYDPAACCNLCQACPPLLTLPLVLTTPTRVVGPLPACRCSAVLESHGFLFFSLFSLIRPAANLISERRLKHFVITYISVSHPLCILQDDDGKVESRFD